MKFRAIGFQSILQTAIPQAGFPRSGEVLGGWGRVCFLVPIEQGKRPRPVHLDIVLVRGEPGRPEPTRVLHGGQRLSVVAGHVELAFAVEARAPRMPEAPHRHVDGAPCNRGSVLCNTVAQLSGTKYLQGTVHLRVWKGL